MLATLRQEISPHWLAQGLQGIELLVKELGPTVHAGFRYFAEAFRTMAQEADRCAGHHTTLRIGDIPR